MCIYNNNYYNRRRNQGTLISLRTSTGRWYLIGYLHSAGPWERNPTCYHGGMINFANDNCIIVSGKLKFFKSPTLNSVLAKTLLTVISIYNPNWMVSVRIMWLFTVYYSIKIPKQHWKGCFVETHFPNQ